MIVEATTNSHSIIDKLLEPYKHVLNEDHLKYRNHACRVFLNCLAMDKDASNIEKYAIAAVFHDIGIWTNNTIDYLAPSIEQAKKYLLENGRGVWIEEISQMIYWHHKTSSYKGEYERIVEAFRRADYIDVTFGLITYSLDRKTVAAIRKPFPNAGFHLFLLKKIGKRLLLHPLNPLPMFTK